MAGRSALAGIALAALLAISVGIARAPTGTIIHVDCANTTGIEDGTADHPYDTIQEGIDAAIDGDTVLVEPCTYHENVDFLGKAITVTGTDPLDPEVAAATVIDGNGAGTVVTFASGEGQSSVLTGFTITNGGAVAGYGILGDVTSPTITHNSIIGNDGAGIHSHRGSPIITENTISGNAVGIYCYWHCLPTIEGNSITGNAEAGIYTWGSEATIRDNLIANNTGGGIVCVGGDAPYPSSADISGNTISGNRTAGSGGGIVTSGVTRVNIANNTIARNVAEDWGGGVIVSRLEPETWPATIVDNVIYSNSGTLGGGLMCDGTSGLVANNTIVANVAYIGGGVDCGYRSPRVVNNVIAFNSSGVSNYWEGTPVLSNNCVYGNAAGDYQGLPDPTGTDGNISVDPLLAAPHYGNLHIQPSSPCRDAGDGSVVTPDWVDMDGEDRVQGPAVDIGADESDGTTWPVTTRIVRVRTDGDDGNDGSTWPLATRTVGAAIAAAAETGGEVWVSAGVYAERVALPAGVYLYGGFDGTEGARSERDWSANAAILDGEQAGSVITIIAAGHYLSTVDGFTIRNGRANYGGGIHCEGSSLDIVNNVFTGNATPMDTMYAAGGGIYCQASPVVISNNTFTDNTGYEGGGVYCIGSSPTVTDNVFSGNHASSGGALSCEDTASITITGNVVTGNSADWRAGGMDCRDDAAAEFSDNIITGNSAGAYGGGVSCSFPGSLAGNLISGNTALGGGGGVSCFGPTTIVGNTISENSSDSGGGVYVDQGAATVTDNAITHNTATRGGGIYCDYMYQRPVIERNSVSDNQASDVGGGIYLWQCAAIVEDNTVADNAAANYGGGISCAWCSPDVIGNSITGNRGKWGGGISCVTEGAQPRIAGNTIGLNEAAERGGGVDCCQGASPDIAANIISGNGAMLGAGVACQQYASPGMRTNIITGNTASVRGGGLYCYDHASPEIANCTIADNTGSSGDGIFCQNHSSPTVCNSIIWNRIFALPATAITVAYSDTLDCWPGVGNMCAVPEFVDPGSGDYHLLSTSPCIDVGSNECVAPDDVDIDGDPRIWPAGGIVDMGADEMVCECDVAVDRTHCKMPTAGWIGQCKTGQIGARNLSLTESCDVVLRVIDNAGTVVFETTRTIGLGRGIRVRFEHCYTADEVGRNLWSWEVWPVECGERTPWDNVYLRKVNVSPRGAGSAPSARLPLRRVNRR